MFWARRSKLNLCPSGQNLHIYQLRIILKAAQNHSKTINWARIRQPEGWKLVNAEISIVFSIDCVGDICVARFGHIVHLLR